MNKELQSWPRVLTLAPDQRKSDFVCRPPFFYTFIIKDDHVAPHTITLSEVLIYSFSWQQVQQLLK